MDLIDFKPEGDMNNNSSSGPNNNSSMQNNNQNNQAIENSAGKIHKLSNVQ